MQPCGDQPTADEMLTSSASAPAAAGNWLTHHSSIAVDGNFYYRTSNQGQYNYHKLKIETHIICVHKGT
jgi:hypothetical protein